jgi:hypothetical protein
MVYLLLAGTKGPSGQVARARRGSFHDLDIVSVAFSTVLVEDSRNLCSSKRSPDEPVRPVGRSRADEAVFGRGT